MKNGNFEMDDQEYMVTPNNDRTEFKLKKYIVFDLESK